MADQVKRVVVTVDDRHLESLDQLVADLERAGLRDIQTLPQIGIVTGAVAPERFAALEQVAGVAAVEPDGEMRAI